MNSFQQKTVEAWTGEDCFDWAVTEVQKFQLQSSSRCLDQFKKFTGKDLLHFGNEQFCQAIDSRDGPKFYALFQDYINNINPEQVQGSLPLCDFFLQSIDEDRSDTLVEPPTPILHQDIETDSQANPLEPKPWNKKYSSRTQNRPDRERGPICWEYLLELIQDPAYNPSHIRWEDRAMGTFRIMKDRKEEVARNWGSRKGDTGKKQLQYDNFARSLRYHYGNGYLEKVSEKNHVFQFGPEAMKLLEGNPV